MKNFLGLVIIAGLAFILTAGVQSAQAGRKQWSSSSSDGRWSRNNNWVGVVGAGPGDELAFETEYCWFGPTNCFIVFNRQPLNDFPINTSFDRFVFSGDSFDIRGNQLILENGISMFGGETTFSPHIILGERQTWDIRGHFTQNGIVHLNNQTLTIDGTGRVELNNLINGQGGILKNGDGKLTISGDADGFGGTALREGTLELTGYLGRLVISGGTLQGTGVVSSQTVFSTADRGTVSPGGGTGSIGNLTFAGGLRIGRDEQTTLAIDLQSTSTGGISDKLRVFDDDLSLLNARLDVFFTTPPTVGQTFTILQQVGAGDIVGQFEQGTALVKDNQLFFITYFPNKVVLTAQGFVGP